MIKIERTPVQLKANIPHNIPVNAGIESERAQLFFRFNPLSKDIILSIKFADSNGRSITESINILANGSNDLILDVYKLINRGVEVTNFVSIEFTSSDDFIFEFWAEEGEVIFGL